ncbi:hypothetical protein RJI07_02685 [Mycoplasmatota bacterium WC30]
MKIKYITKNSKTINESIVLATFYRKNINLIKRLFSRNERFVKYYMVLVPVGDVFKADYIEENRLLRITDKKEPTEWIKIKKHKSVLKRDSVTEYFISLHNLSCYSWMIAEEDFFVSVFEYNDSVRQLIFEKLPYLIHKMYDERA